RSDDAGLRGPGRTPAAVAGLPAPAAVGGAEPTINTCFPTCLHVAKILADSSRRCRAAGCAAARPVRLQRPQQRPGFPAGPTPRATADKDDGKKPPDGGGIKPPQRDPG